MTRKRNYSVKWTQIAEDDLVAIVDYIAADNPDAALSIFDRIRTLAKELVSFPERGRVVPELQRFGISQYRELLPAPWRLIFRIGDGEVFVVAVFDGRRDLEDILLERIIRN